jgi:hypothetical protein
MAVRAPEVTFEIWGPDIDPEAITRILGVDPSECCQKGPYKVTDLDGNTYNGNSPSASWLLRTGDCVASPSPTDHTDYVLELLRAHAVELKAIAARAKLSFCLRLPADTPSPYPAYGQLEAAVRKLGLGIDFDAMPEPHSPPRR